MEHFVMDNSPQQQLQQAMAEFAAKHKALIEAKEQVSAISVTARSKDGSVEVTVGAKGEASGMRFPNNKFQSMSGQALAASVLEALSVARTEAATRATAIFESVAGGPPAGAGSSVLDRVDLDRLLDPAGVDEVLAPRRKGGGGRV
ncbi:MULTISPECIES: YbaB/EbfC family nucleoid-associated protein [Streptomyces]|uniref:YbaB/EbfC family nucleoid-associated protein n=1 Tax=Streptomyces TaxID=1883 RepID=UPI0023DD479C|nr:YbaB/EbfC family nucleoid-associated protein [Streptomyces sp. FXJ1.172]WEP00906.1 YbaB/EbfC family nucleoid-associated protein [Streptomyces sp. FXJ1.172]